MKFPSQPQVVLAFFAVLSNIAMLVAISAMCFMLQDIYNSTLKLQINIPSSTVKPHADAIYKSLLVLFLLITFCMAILVARLMPVFMRPLMKRVKRSGVPAQVRHGKTEDPGM